MQHHIKVTIGPLQNDAAEILIALLAEGGYEGFVENGEQLEAYIPEQQFDADKVDETIAFTGAQWAKEVIVPQNWNAIWESSFEPVIVPGFVAVRAGFHAPVTDVQYELVITPKMSFGTGHHATTLQMMQLMRDIDFSGKKVFDFGTGTGVLAILAEKMGAAEVLAIDNDEWSIDNAEENIRNNACTHIKAILGTEPPIDQTFDVALANINRHILLQYMGAISQCLNNGGALLISGFYDPENHLLEAEAFRHNLVLAQTSVHNNWSALVFTKSAAQHA